MRIPNLLQYGNRAAAVFTLAGSFAVALSTTSLAEKKLEAVALTVGDLGNPFFVAVQHGAQDKAKQINSKVKFTAETSNYDVKTQSDQIDKAIASKVDLLLLGAANSQEIAPAVERAKKAGLIVIAVDVGADGGVDATITSNNKQAGQIDAKYIGERLKGKGEVVAVNGEPVTAVTDRMAGFLEQMKSYPEIKILSHDQNAEGSRAGGQRVMKELLAKFPKIDAVFAVNDPTAIGCDLATKEAQRKEFFIVGVDGAPEMIPHLKDPNDLIAATAAQDPYLMAQQAIEVGYNLMQDKKPKESLILIRVGLITKENVGRYAGWSR
jgi:ribose transport system substrate-binding protein